MRSGNQLVERDGPEAGLACAVPADVKPSHRCLNLGEVEARVHETPRDDFCVLGRSLVSLNGMKPDGEHGELFNVRAPKILKLIPQVKSLERLE
jgi:hypothetical protein